ncbi:MAG: class I SAM-dependent rRNA methyltransferase [Thermodesulfobacteriota bacterium]
MKSLPKVILKSGREGPILRGHPWIFSGAIERIEGDVAPGDEGEVYSQKGEFLGIGHINPKSQIFLRLLTRKREELGEGFFYERLIEAAKLRERFLRGKTNAYRIVNGEGDFLPGLIIDRYRNVIVIQITTAGMDRLKSLIVKILIEYFSPQSIYERSDTPLRKEEGLDESKGLLFGKEVTQPIEIDEYGCLFRVDILEGQKTGFYLDQRENRLFFQSLAEGKKVLDVFSYTGAFSIHGELGGARELTLVESSEEALKRAREHVELNKLNPITFQFIKGDAFEVLRKIESSFDLIVLDPPPFAKRKGELSGALRGHKDLHLHAFSLLRPEGLLLTFSCSHHIGWDLFEKAIFSAACDIGRKVQLLARRGQPIDHPFSLFHPEGEYLKGFLLRVL